VDDDDDVRDALRDILEDRGYEVAEASDGGAALRYLRTHARPLAVLLDWNMAPVNGAAFMEERSRDLQLREVPIILMTADRRVQRMEIGGFSGRLEKPLVLDDLYGLLDRLRHPAT
jgi:two-component system chemotaxis response regulator CheY